MLRQETIDNGRFAKQYEERRMCIFDTSIYYEQMHIRERHERINDYVLSDPEIDITNYQIMKTLKLLNLNQLMNQLINFAFLYRLSDID